MKLGRWVMSVLAVTAACGVDPLAISTTDFTAKLDGASEVPAVTTTATGTATANRVGSTIVYSVTYSGLSGAPTASHIHIGAQGAAGPVRFNFCGTGAPVPACPTGVAGTISGTGDATFLAGGISLDSLNSAMKAGNAYVNIHTATNAGGEIRGLLVGKR